jgi:alpha-tubulin suppressor-like RCC1 family protein
MTQLTMGQQHLCELYGKTVYCRGRNEGHQLGHPNQFNTPNETLVTGLPASGLDAIAASDWATCGITLAPDAGPSNVWCWGWNDEGECGRRYSSLPNPPNQDIAYPVVGEIDGGPTGAIPDAIAIAGGGLHHCAITSQRAIWCWGSTQFYESGPLPGITCPGGYARMCSDQPQTMTLPDKALPVALALGERHSCALADNGNVYCWGANDLNQLATNGASVTQSCALNGATMVPCTGTAVKVSGLPANLPPTTTIRAGGYQTCILDPSGHAYCWGRNDFGELGQGDTAPRQTAVVLSDMNFGTPIVFSEIAVGASRHCGRTSNAILCWGSPELGTTFADGGTQDNRWPAPVQFY